MTDTPSSSVNDGKKAKNDGEEANHDEEEAMSLAGGESEMRGRISENRALLFYQSFINFVNIPGKQEIGFDEIKAKPDSAAGGALAGCRRQTAKTAGIPAAADQFFYLLISFRLQVAPSAENLLVFL